MTRRSWSCFAFALALALFAPAPSVRASATAPDSVVHFTVVRNKVLVPVRVNGSRPLRLILDTGMGYDGVLLFDPALKDSLGGARLAAANIGGAGGGRASQAFVAESLSLGVGETRIENQRVIVLADSAMMGGAGDGVIGYSLLGRYAVELDYDRSEMTLHDWSKFRPSHGWGSMLLRFDRNQLPFIYVQGALSVETPALLEAYIDLASSETIEMLIQPGMKIRIPARTTEVLLGRGLSGDIRGRRGTLSQLAIGGFEFKKVTAAFVPAEARSKAKAADAVLGNGALCRFNVVFDYGHQLLHMKPNHHEPDALP